MATEYVRSWIDSAVDAVYLAGTVIKYTVSALVDTVWDMFDAQKHWHAFHHTQWCGVDRVHRIEDWFGACTSIEFHLDPDRQTPRITLRHLFEPDLTRHIECCPVGTLTFHSSSGERLSEAVEHALSEHVSPAQIAWQDRTCLVFTSKDGSLLTLTTDPHSRTIDMKVELNEAVTRREPSVA